MLFLKIDTNKNTDAWFFLTNQVYDDFVSDICNYVHDTFISVRTNQNSSIVEHYWKVNYWYVSFSFTWMWIFMLYL